MISGLSKPALRKLLLRLAVAAGLLLLAVRLALREEGASLGPALAGAWTTGPGLALLAFTLAFVILGLSYGVGAARFGGLLRSADLDVSWRALFRGYVAAGFFNLVLPGAILGDVYRAWDTRRDVGRGSEVAGLVALERLLSLGALGCVGLAVAPALPLSSEDSGLAWLLVAVSSCFVVGTGLALLPPANRALRRATGALSRFSPRIATVARKALAAVATAAAQPGVVARACALSLLCQGLPVVAVFVLAAPLDTGVAWYWYAVIVPFVTLVALVPISIGGAGVRESLYVLIFGAVGMRTEVALALSLSAFAVSLAWAVVGFAVVARDRRSARRPADGAS